MNKYRARKTEYNGIIYDSKAEAALAQEIDILIRAGEVKSVERQQSFSLYGKSGGMVGVHRVDFLLCFPDDHIEVWEYKGYVARDYPLRRNLFEDNYPHIKYVVRTNGKRRSQRRTR